jgi:hypothetical protein
MGAAKELRPNGKVAGSIWRERCTGVKRAFFACLAIWLVGGGVATAVGREIDNFDFIFVDVFGSAALLLGVFLVAHWARSKVSSSWTLAGR